jgi:ferredoxin-NADP reductase
MICCYSMSSVAGKDGYRISVRLVRDCGSSYLHHRVHVADIVAAAAPRGSFATVSVRSCC